MKTEYDVIVIGGGINGLATAAYLQKAGMAVAVFESRDESGTFCATEEVLSPGVKLNLHASLLITHFGPAMVDLELERFGLELCRPPQSDYNYFYPFVDGDAVLFASYDVRKTYDMWLRISKNDAEVYRKIANAMAPTLDDFWQGALCAKRTDEGFLELLDGLGKLPVLPKDWLWMTGFELVDAIFENEKIKLGVLSAAALAAEDLTSRLSGPLAVLGALVAYSGQALMTARGGSHDVTHALVRCFVHHGGKIYYNCPVEKVMLDGRKATGVVLNKSGCYPNAEFRARRAVISDLSAKATFLGLIGEQNLPLSARVGLKRFDYRGGSLFTNYYVLNERPHFAAAKKFPEVDNTFAFNFGADTIDEALRAFETCDVRGLPPDPPVAWGGCANYCIADPTQAPPGHYTVMSWAFVPYDLNSMGGPQKWDEIRESYADKVEDKLSCYLSNLKSAKVARYVNTPHDYTRRNPHCFGNMHPSGRLTEAQFWSWKPFSGCGAPKTPIEGLYICQSMGTQNYTHLGTATIAANEVVSDLGVVKPEWWRAKALDAAKELWAREGITQRFTIE
jgi:phytoene dehydrogenase-like protein